MADNMTISIDFWPRDLEEPDQLLDCCRVLVHDRIHSLQVDVESCVEGPPPAPFPALLYCFATIDLLGALVGGNGKSNGSDLAKGYMTRFMRYAEESVRLLQNQFRHKLVHLAQPKSVIRDNDRLIAWVTYLDSAEDHLQLRALKQPQIGEYGPEGQEKWSAKCSHQFSICVRTFAHDIKDSAVGTGGYLNVLQTDQDLQRKARHALQQIFEP